jgi:hypothetical protein
MRNPNPYLRSRRAVYEMRNSATDDARREQDRQRKLAMIWRAIARRWRDAPLRAIVINYHDHADDAEI